MSTFWMVHTGALGDVLGFYETLLEANTAANEFVKKGHHNADIVELRGFCPRLQGEVHVMKHNLMLVMQIAIHQAQQWCNENDD